MLPLASDQSISCECLLVPVSTSVTPTWISGSTEMVRCSKTDANLFASAGAANLKL
jgi:hypothetical protein